MPDLAYEEGLSALSEITERTKCAGCGGSRMYFCYVCCRLVPRLEGRLPSIEKFQLPLSVWVIRHDSEVAGKSTGCHLPLFAQPSTHVQLSACPLLPENTAVVYPDSSSATVAEYLGRGQSLAGVVFLDCTWSQAGAMHSHPHIAGLPRLRLEGEYQTQFWRPQRGHPDTDLATLEAIYYFLREYSDAAQCPLYLRPIMLLYDFLHRKIKGEPFVFPD